MGDAQLAAESCIHNWNLGAFYSNFISLMRDDQQQDGAIAPTAPWTWGDMPAEPAWAGAYPAITYYLWRYYGDTNVVKEVCIVLFSFSSR